METKKIKKHLNVVGVAGEYFVAAALSQRGIVATLTLKNTPRIDVLATNLENGRVANIQVKTMSIGNDAGWHLNESDENHSGIKNHFYVLVNLRNVNSLPDFIIIPQKHLSAFLKKDYSDWIGKAKRDGSNRKRTKMRIFDPYRKKHIMEFAKKYINQWDLLGL
jgi:hypothetical protein